MNKEEIEDLQHRIYNLSEENNKLKDRINKSINYIENDLKSFIYSIEYKTLIKILKGE